MYGKISYINGAVILKFIDKKLIKFLIVGVINTIVGAGVMFLLYNLAHCSYWVSSAANYVVGGIVSYFLNKFFTFQNKQKSFKQVLFFILNLAISYVIAYVLAKIIICWILASQTVAVQENVAMLVGMVLYTGINYIGQRLVVFKEINR